jgi:hypothetical protein
MDGPDSAQTSIKPTPIKIYQFDGKNCSDGGLITLGA